MSLKLQDQYWRGIKNGFSSNILKLSIRKISMNIAITLVHNKTAAENEAQIEALKPLIEIQEETFDEYDSEGNVIGQFTKNYYTIKGLTLEHRALFFQVVPFGVTEPTNLYDIDSHKVIYGVGDEDKIGDHPRFFNWGLKRGTDYGADVVIHIDDASKFDPTKISIKLDKVLDEKDKTEYAEDTYGKISSLRLLKEVGQLKEDQTLLDAITDLKARVVEGGYKNG